MRKFTIAIFTVVFLLLYSTLTSDVIAEDRSQPFHPGERLIYELKWEFVHAGMAELRVLPMENINGKPAYHFMLIAESNSFVDIFYKVRDRIDAYTDTEMTKTVFYRKQQREGGTRRDVEVTFDWENNKATYANHGKKDPPIDLLPGTFDPLGTFYYTRFQELNIGDELNRPVTDGNKSVIGRARVIKRETLKVAAGTFDTFLMEPELQHVGGVFEKDNDAKIQLWVTADGRAIPVKIASKVAVGSFVAELTQVISGQEG